METDSKNPNSCLSFEKLKMLSHQLQSRLEKPRGPVEVRLETRGLHLSLLATCHIPLVQQLVVKSIRGVSDMIADDAMRMQSAEYS